jgi:hypothetical protein
MANIDKFTEQKAMFLKAADVIAHPANIFRITGEAILTTSEKFQNERLHIPGFFGTDEKIFDCSKTNARILQTALGSDTAKWLGAELTFETFKTRTSDGKMVDALNVKAVKKI